MSSPNNNALSDNEVVEAPKAAAQAINSGDLVKITANLIVPVSAGTDSCWGLCEDTSPVVSLGDQLSAVVVRRRGIVRLFLLAGDTAAYGALLYPTADPQIVTVTDPGAGKACAKCLEMASVVGAAGSVTRIKAELKTDS